MNLEIKLNASGSWLWAIVVCLAPLWSVPAMAQQLGTSQGTAGTSSRAQLTQAQAQYDEAKAKAVTAAQNLINANTPQNLQDFAAAASNAFQAGRNVLACSERCSAEPAPAQAPPNHLPSALGAATYWMFRDIVDDRRNNDFIRDPLATMEDDLPTPPPHSVIDDLKPRDKFTDELPNEGEPTFTVPGSQLPIPPKTTTTPEPGTQSSSGGSTSGARVTTPSMP
jgi:hypothetical protein